MNREERKVLIDDIWTGVVVIVAIAVLIFTAIKAKEYILLGFFLFMLVPIFMLIIGGPGVYYWEKWKNKKNDNTP